MVIFKSTFPSLDIPNDISDWDFFFDSKWSPIHRVPKDQIAGWTDALTGNRIDFLQARNFSTWVSTVLVKKHGLKAGDTISLFSHNTIWYPIALFGGIRAGAKISGASPAYNVEEMTYALKTADAKFLFTTKPSLKVALASAQAAGLPKERIFLLEGEEEGFGNLQQLIEEGKAYGELDQIGSYKISRGKTNFDVCGFLSFSSGTTGLPKAVMIAHSNVIGQCMQLDQIASPDYKKVLAVVPLFHISGLVHFIHYPLLRNSEVYMLPAFSMQTMLETVSKYRIKDLFLVPPIVIQLVRNPIVKDYDLSFVKRIFSGAAPTPHEIIQLVEKQFPGSGFRQGYGMTESCSCITSHPHGMMDYKYAHKGGMIVANTEVKVIKDDGTEGDVGEPGEILARGPQVVMGYLNNEEATRSTFDSDGFLHTGDSGFIDSTGMIQILDRIKEMIKVKGIGVAPAELEDLLQGHPSIADCAVMGVPDDYAGELPKAFIVLKEGVPATEETGKEIIGWVKEKKVKYKWIKQVEFLSEVPKSASGKILRRILKDREKDKTLKRMVVRDETGTRAKL